MATFSSTENNIHRSDSTRMYPIGQTPLARLRPEKLDDMALKKQISLIQEVCGDIDPDSIAMVYHECDYNMQTTIARLKAGDFEDGGWQTAKSSNKKKNHNINPTDQLSNGGIQSDSERSLSQRTSPTPSLRDAITRERQRKDQYPYSSRSHTNRRGNDFHRNPTNSRYPKRTYPVDNTKPISNPTEVPSSSKANEEITPTTSSSTDEYEFIGGTSQSLTFDNSLKKSPLSSFTKRPTPSSIPREPVSMHPTIQFSTEPIDIQFGDVQWNDSVPIAITPSNSPILIKSSDEQSTDVQDHSSTNIVDRELHETIDRFSPPSFEITHDPLTNNSTEETSHLSDQLDKSAQQPTSQTPQQFLANLSNTNPSAFSPYSTPTSTFQSIPRDYSQTWNHQQSPNYKPTTKPTMMPTGTYPPQTSYQLPPQQYYMGHYSYPTPTAFYPMITPVDSWSNTGYEPYPTYTATNYFPTYPTQQQYHPNTKQDHYPYDKEFLAAYGQSRVANNELANLSQSTKETSLTSKLSATAASFSQATSPTTAFVINPLLYTLPTYYAPHQDRTMAYPSIATRDNRNGASYSSGSNNRNPYYQHQRSHNNSTWHPQQ